MDTGRDNAQGNAQAPRLLCENFLYGFKAARRAARAANTARTPQLPLALPQRRRKTPVGWREKKRTAGRFRHTTVTSVQLASQ